MPFVPDKPKSRFVPDAPAEQPLPVPAGTRPFEPGLGERALRYMGEWGQAMRDAATEPGGGPTGIDVIDVPAGVADAALTVATGAIAPLGAGMLTEARRASNPTASYAEAVDDLTWQPRVPVGKTIINTAGAVLKPAGDAIGAVFGGAADLAGHAGASPVLQQDIREVVPTIAESALDLGVLRGARGAIRRGGEAVNPTPPSPTPGGEPLRPFGPEVEQARRLDLRLTPSQVAAKAQMNSRTGEFNVSVPGTIREAFTTPDFHTQAIIDNQKRVNTFAARELGLPETGRIEPAALGMAKAPHNAVFDEVTRSLPVLRTDWELGNAANAIGEARRTNPLLQNSTAVEAVRDRLLTMESVPTQQALDAIRSYRQDANKLFHQAEVGGSGVGVLEAEQAAFAYKAAADALEAAIERQAGVLYPDLVPRLRDARTALAKIHNVEDALVNGNVDPQRLAKLADKFPLSGYLGEIAVAARNFPDTLKLATGLDMPIQTQQGALNSLSLAARRAFGHAQGPSLLRDDFQSRFGRADPNFDPRVQEGSPFPAPPAPPSPDLPFEPSPNVMPPAPGGGPAITATDLGAQFDELPPADAFPGDLTASTPPAQGGIPFAASDLGLADALAPDVGLEVPPSRFTAGDTTFDNGLDFALDPEMAAAPIVRGGGTPGTVQDSLLLDEALMGPELTGRPLDVETGATLSPDMEPYTRPASDLGDQFDLVPDPRTDVVPFEGMEGEFIQGSPPPRGPRRPRFDEGAEDAIPPDALPFLGDAFPDVEPRALPAPQGRLPAPEVQAPEVPRGSRRGSEQWKNEGKSDADLMAERVANEADGIAALLREGTIEPGELRGAVRQWAGDAGIPEDDLRAAVRQRVPDAPLRPEALDTPLGDELSTDLPVSEEARNVGRGIGRRIAEGKRARRAAQDELADVPHSELVRRLSEHRKKQPRPLDKLYGKNGPTPEQAAQHAEQTRAWNRENARLRRALPAALERDNAAFRARQERSLGDELALEDDAPRGKMSDEPTDVTPTEAPRREAGKVEVVEITDPYQIPDEMHERGNFVLRDGDLRSIELEPGEDGALTIRATHVDGGSQGRGLGQQNYLDAAKFAAERGVQLNGDQSLTRAAWRSLKAAIDKGLIEADVPYEAIEAAFQRDPGVAKNPSGKSWVTNIRLGPAG